MLRALIVIGILIQIASGSASAQVPVSVEKDVIFSRTNGSAVLADIAYPVEGTDRPAII